MTDSNLVNEIEYNEIPETLKFCLDQYMKDIYIALPGIVQSYNPATRRAVVIPALSRVFTDNTNAPLPPLVDVPVIFPCGGGCTMTFPLATGDAVQLNFNQRGIANFKANFHHSLPCDESFFSLNDAVAYAGFGDISITPASSTGATLQSNDGANAVILEPAKIQLKLGTDATVIVQADQIALKLSVANLTLSNDSLVSSVPIQAPGYAGNAGGAAIMTAGIDMNSQNITNAGDVTTQSGISLKTHKHLDVTTGTDETGEPV